MEIRITFALRTRPQPRTLVKLKDLVSITFFYLGPFEELTRLTATARLTKKTMHVRRGIGHYADEDPQNHCVFSSLLPHNR